MENINNKTVLSSELFPIVREFILRGQKVRFIVSGDSMLPWIAHNKDRVLIAGISGRRLKPGDIILFQNDFGKYILHRICREEAGGYRTIGDACLFEDDIVLPENIIGIVEKIYRRGKEIDCRSFHWRFIFYVWCHLLPIREPLMKAFLTYGHIKQVVKQSKGTN